MPTKEFRREVEERFANGETPIAIARELGCRYQVVYDMLRRSHDLAKPPVEEVVRLRWLVGKGVIP